ncbi:MAG: hypothetical protein ABIQ16_27520 [Polyangiaceae bacterium]
MVTRYGSLRPSLRRRAAASALALLCGATELHADEAYVPSERTPPPRTMSPYVAGAVWATAQLVPSPLLVTGKQHVGGGLRWQLTPLLYSFGIAERPLRTFYVSPIARHSGSVELHVSPEWACCAPGDRSSWLVRAGLRLYLPLLEHGERLSWSLGAAYYRATGENGASADLGVLAFNGALGLNVTVSPWLSRREVITALTLRYF